MADILLLRTMKSMQTFSQVKNTEAVTPLRAIAIILAHGVIRLHQRQKDLDNRTEQSVHDCVLVTEGETQ
jgi:hypothetical protein